MLRHARAPLLGVACALLLAAAPAPAWSPKLQEMIAHDAARLAPPDLARQLARRGDTLAAGAVQPFSDTEAARHVKNPDGSGSLDAALAAEVDRAIAALRDHRPFDEVTVLLGRVAHWAADLSNPLNTSNADAEEGRYFRDFLAYSESARPRFAVVVYEWRAPVSDLSGVDTLAREALDRGRRLYPYLGAEYRRIEFGSGAERFDDRSTAFGLAALAYSHAVTDVARLFRYIWLASGGADRRLVFTQARDRILVLEQGGAR